MKSGDRGRIRIAVLGNGNVGKSALTVRYLTRRFIGEYRSNTDLLYRQAVLVNGSFMDVEIIDVSGETRDSIGPEQALQAGRLADGFVVVYSITDRQSYGYAERVLQQLSSACPPVTLLANKADLEHLRTVDAAEGRALAERVRSPFHEVSVADNTANIYRAFELLVAECRASLNNNNNNNDDMESRNSNSNSSSNNSSSNSTSKVRKFSVTKMLGNLMGSGKSSSPPPSSGQGLSQGLGQGTVVVCSKSDLYRSTVLKRRISTSASL